MSYKQYLKLENTKTGKGVISTVQIPAHSMIIEKSGTIVTLNHIPNNESSHFYLQVGLNSFIGPSGWLDDYLNHSCDPNCRMHIVGNRAFLYSLYVIPIGNELTFDYSTTSTDTLDSWQMECKCGSNKCRKIISGIQHVDSKTYQHYYKNNMLPMYITKSEIFLK